MMTLWLVPILQKRQDRGHLPCQIYAIQITVIVFSIAEINVTIFFLIWLSKVVDKLFQTLQLILVTSEWKFKLFSDFGINNQKILMFSDCRVYI